jgi:hypothetical protein
MLRQEQGDLHLFGDKPQLFNANGDQRGSKGIRPAGYIC